jgi:hypothetical protein
MERNLTKLQIRSEVLLMLQKLNSLDEMSKDQQDYYLAKMRSISDVEYVLDVLVKELARVDYKKGQLISLFLQELGELESLQEILWSYIKSPKSSDELKDISGIILKSLGDQTDPEEFLNYLEDPKAIVDKETQKLLEVASVNPEAQIDFLDFLFSLPEPEQINLVASLKEDYSSEYLVNVAVPALEAKSSQKLEEELIRILGETRSVYAVPALNDVIKYSLNDMTKKHAQKSLNMLKLAGVDVTLKDKISKAAPITKTAEIYECHTNIIDGIGNQGFIISRIKPNNDILMMNVVVNDLHGIIDCFGFYGISKYDFKRIIEKFQEMTTRFYVSPEYCKLKLEQAEQINKENNLPIPYEYAAWKSLISDVSPLETDFEAVSKKWTNPKLMNETVLLYKFPDFQHWYFEEEDHPAVNELLSSTIEELESKAATLVKSKKKLFEWFNEKMDLFSENIFNTEIKEIYKNRLIDIAHLLEFQGLEFFRDIAATLAWGIVSESDDAIKRIPFFKKLIKRTIVEGILRYQFRLEEKIKTPSATPLKKKSAGSEVKEVRTPDKNIDEIIEILYEDD